MQEQSQPLHSVHSRNTADTQSGPVAGAGIYLANMSVANNEPIEDGMNNVANNVNNNSNSNVTSGAVIGTVISDVERFVETSVTGF